MTDYPILCETGRTRRRGWYVHIQADGLDVLHGMYDTYGEALAWLQGYLAQARQAS